MTSASTLEASPAGAQALRALVDAGRDGADAFCEVAQEALAALLADAEVLPPVLADPTDRLTRRLVFSDPAGRFGIWLLTWPPGCRTPVHNHHCACAFGVCRGAIEEVLYATAGGSDAVVESSRAVRLRGYVGGAAPEQGVVHAMVNRGPEAATSLHIYAYRPDRHPDSIDRRFSPRHPA
jgi:predicted metal-dependent enzyme (double-stranded beta helix superfamily)